MELRGLDLNDALLLTSLLFVAADTCKEWEMYDTCAHPIHVWLLASIGCVVAMRLAHALGNLSVAAQNGTVDLLLDLRHKNMTSRLLADFVRWIGLPALALLTLLGGVWARGVLRSSPGCLPTTGHRWFLLAWVGVCAFWVLSHCSLGVVGMAMERGLRSRETELRNLEDVETLSRWGARSSRQDLEDGVGTGLTAAQLGALPVATAEAALGDCAVCLQPIRGGEGLRRLARCGHGFHRACVDLWLVQRAECPLCRASVACG